MLVFRSTIKFPRKKLSLGKRNQEAETRMRNNLQILINNVNLPRSAILKALKLLQWPQSSLQMGNVLGNSNSLIIIVRNFSWAINWTIFRNVYPSLRVLFWFVVVLLEPFWLNTISNGSKNRHQMLFLDTRVSVHSLLKVSLSDRTPTPFASLPA